MDYEAPAFTEIKMDAEIGSYQNDFDGGEAPRFVSPEPAEAAESHDAEG